MAARQVFRIGFRCITLVSKVPGRMARLRTGLVDMVPRRRHIPRNMKIVLDTDVVVAALRSRLGASRSWLHAVLAGEVTLLLSVPLALQYEAVLTRPEHLARSGARIADIGTLLDALCAICEPVGFPICGGRPCGT